MTFVYIIVGVVVLFFALQMSVVLSAKKSKGTKLEGLSGRLKPLERKGSKGLVYFFSPSCRACKVQTPVIKTLQKSYKNIYDVDISSDMQTARLFGVKATPMTVLVRDGVIDQVFVGVKQKEIFEPYLKETR